MFRLPDSWVWDFWLADDGQRYHLFFLFASRALHNPPARHLRASIGHAVSVDLTDWRRVEDAVVRGESGDFDDVATWTGSTVRHPDGTWYLFYTGTTRGELGVIQTIGYATSPDLTTWTKNHDNPVLRADSRWYETLGTSTRDEEAFRDPWVFPDPDGDGWHMLITSRANTGDDDNRGVVGHAWSPDLREWNLGPPLSQPGQGFAQLEVMQVETVSGRPTLLFSCLRADTGAERQEAGIDSGVWTVETETLLGPYDLAGATPLTDSDLYSGRIIRDRTGTWQLLAFLQDETRPDFGQISDPKPFRHGKRSSAVTPRRDVFPG